MTWPRGRFRHLVLSSTKRLRDRGLTNIAPHSPECQDRPDYGAMGIRYYAYPITSDQYPAAREDPCPFHGTDPLMDAWGPLEDRPEMLYLDKCWREFQILLGPDSGSIDRPALQLVDGEVTHVPMGWIAYERALSPAQVRDVATDLATVNDSDVRRMLPAFSRRGGSEPDDLDYVTVYLAAAREFVDRLANDGRGLVYLIG